MTVTKSDFGVTSKGEKALKPAWLYIYIYIYRILSFRK